MKNLIFIIIFIISYTSTYSQTYNNSGIYGVRNKREAIDSVLHLPTLADSNVKDIPANRAGGAIKYNPSTKKIQYSTDGIKYDKTINDSGKVVISPTDTLTVTDTLKVKFVYLDNVGSYIKSNPTNVEISPKGGKYIYVTGPFVVDASTSIYNLDIIVNLAVGGLIKARGVNVNTTNGGFAVYNYDSGSGFYTLEVQPNFIPTRLTASQIAAISSPSLATTIFCTDCTSDKLTTGVTQTYDGSVWQNQW